MPDGLVAAAADGRILTAVEFSSARYTRVLFPRYAYRPGVNPHPTAGPRGHSYRSPGNIPTVVAPVAPEDWQRSSDYLFGCDLYNHGYWWEAHEAWEGLWQLVEKTAAQGRFLKGLIQVSACALKVAVGNRRGAQRLLERGSRHLDTAMDQAADPRFMGLALASFQEVVNAYYRPRLDEGAAVTHDPDVFPYIILRTEEAQ